MTIGALQLPARHHLVEGQPQAMAVTQSHPADARRQALELDALARHVEPVVQVRVVRQQLVHLGIGAVDVLRVARERDPAERADAAAEQRAHVGGHEAREGEGVLDPRIEGDLAQIVAVVEHRDALLLEGEHRLHVPRHRSARRARHLGRVFGAQPIPLLERPAAGAGSR